MCASRIPIPVATVLPRRSKYPRDERSPLEVIRDDLHDRLERDKDSKLRDWTRRQSRLKSVKWQEQGQGQSKLGAQSRIGSGTSNFSTRTYSKREPDLNDGYGSRPTGVNRIRYNGQFTKGDATSEWVRTTRGGEDCKPIPGIPGRRVGRDKGNPLAPIPSSVQWQNRLNKPGHMNTGNFRKLATDKQTTVAPPVNAKRSQVRQPINGARDPWGGGHNAGPLRDNVNLTLTAGEKDQLVRIKQRQTQLAAQYGNAARYPRDIPLHPTRNYSANNIQGYDRVTEPPQTNLRSGNNGENYDAEEPFYYEAPDPPANRREVMTSMGKARNPSAVSRGRTNDGYERPARSSDDWLNNTSDGNRKLSGITHGRSAGGKPIEQPSYAQLPRVVNTGAATLNEQQQQEEELIVNWATQRPASGTQGLSRMGSEKPGSGKPGSGKPGSGKPGSGKPRSRGGREGSAGRRWSEVDGDDNELSRKEEVLQGLIQRHRAELEALKKEKLEILNKRV